MTKAKNLLLAFAMLSSVVLSSCGGGVQSVTHGDGDTVEFKYAELLQVVDYGDYAVARIADPWKKGRTLHTYILVPEKSGDVDGLPEGTVIHTPLTRAVPFTSVHSSLIMSLERQTSIAGVADLQYIGIPYIKEQCSNGSIADVGNAMNPNVERIIDISPDALLVSPFENSGGYGKVEETGIPIVECADYMETTALGRAEWIKFYGMLLGAESTADSLFCVIDSSYNALKTIVSKETKRPSALIDKMTGAVWYLPGGHSTFGTLLADAAIDYAFADDNHSGSLSLSFETVLEKCGDADIWLFRYSSNHPITYAELLSEHRGYLEMNPFRTRQCYGCNVNTSMFYEEGAFRPDFLLSDFIRIAYPDKKLSGQPHYFKRLPVHDTQETDKNTNDD